jgi:wyosine [tRNA(Phe)-imidazoG37] synthetase (radical SAM superfamily)
MKAFGPVPSRRLGHSLGINNIPPKICTYSCVYCQLGRTTKMQVERNAFYKPEEIAIEVENKFERAREKSKRVDYLTFVPDGEPTLDINISKEIESLKPLNTKIAVITNASLIWREDVKNGLLEADWVSLKIDTVTDEIWRKINRPHKSLKLQTILEGTLRFADAFKGELTTETMLIQDINDNRGEIRRIADFLAELKPDKAYIAIPTRPPAEKWAKPASEQIINIAYQIFNSKLINTEYLIGYEGNAFASTGEVEDDLLSITSVHPMREESVREFLSKTNSKWQIIEKLIEERKLLEVKYRGKKFYMRKLPKSHTD